MSHEKTLRARVRRALRTEKLPNLPPDRMWGGPGTGAPCMVCDEPIEPTENEFELQFPAGGAGEASSGNNGPSAGKSEEESYHIHIRCFEIWEAVRQQRRVLPPGGKGGIMTDDECDTANEARAE